MSDLQFEEEPQLNSMAIEQKPFLIRLVLKTGVVSTDKQAEIVLGILAALLIVLAVYLGLPHQVTETVHHNPGDELLVPGASNPTNL